MLCTKLIISNKNEVIEVTVLIKCRRFHFVSNRFRSNFKSSRLALLKSVLSKSSLSGTLPKMVTNSTPKK